MKTEPEQTSGDQITEEASDPLGAPDSQAENDDDWSPDDLSPQQRERYDRAVKESAFPCRLKATVPCVKFMEARESREQAQGWDRPRILTALSLRIKGRISSRIGIVSKSLSQRSGVRSG